MIRVTVVNRSSGEVIGEIRAPQSFFQSLAFQGLQQELAVAMFSAAVARAADTHELETLFGVIVTRWS